MLRRIIIYWVDCRFEITWLIKFKNEVTREPSFVYTIVILKLGYNLACTLHLHYTKICIRAEYHLEIIFENARDELCLLDRKVVYNLWKRSEDESPDRCP